MISKYKLMKEKETGLFVIAKVEDNKKISYLQKGGKILKMYSLKEAKKKLKAIK